MLLSHPAVAEAVCFGVPDEKYGEVVAAAVVLRPEAASTPEAEVERAIKELCSTKLSAFKVRGKARSKGGGAKEGDPEEEGSGLQTEG